MVHRLEKVPVADCRIEDNIRQMIDDEEIRQLADSLKKRQVHPIFVTTDLRVIDGGKRVRAARLAGLKELLAVITDEVLSGLQILDLQLVSAFHRSDPKHFDKWQAMEAVKASHPDWTNKQTADHFDIDPKMVKIMLSPGQCVKDVQDALREEKIGISVCHELSLLPPEKQWPLLELKLSGLSRDAIAREGRKERNGSGPVERVKRYRLLRPSGNLITLSGVEMSLEEAANELSELAAEMRRAHKDNITIKTFISGCRDKAEAGV